MALSEQNKADILFHLCWPATTLDPESVNFHSIIRDRLNNIGELGESQVIGLLSKIDSIEGKLSSSPAKSNVKQIGDIHLDTEKSLRLIEKESNRLRNRLSALLDIPNKCRGGSCMVSVCQ
jgi:hypothetical protein